MKNLITALGFAALVVAGSAAQARTISPSLTPSERAEIQRLVPEVHLHGLSASQVRALSEMTRSRDHASRAEARHAAINIIRERPWLMPGFR